MAFIIITVAGINYYDALYIYFNQKPFLIA